MKKPYSLVSRRNVKRGQRLSPSNKSKEIYVFLCDHDDIYTQICSSKYTGIDALETYLTMTKDSKFKCHILEEVVNHDS